MVVRNLARVHSGKIHFSWIKSLILVLNLGHSTFQVILLGGRLVDMRNTALKSKHCTYLGHRRGHNVLFL